MRVAIVDLLDVMQIDKAFELVDSDCSGCLDNEVATRAATGTVADYGQLQEIMRLLRDDDADAAKFMKDLDANQVD